ncbi:MAG: ABC transporter ATP-binding protein [Candidatus Planktophila sp.]
MRRQPAIELRNLTKRYGKDRGAEDISFDVFPGEVFGFLGPNGAGKSTVMRTMLGLIEATSGSSYILGRDSLNHNSALMAEIGYLPGALALYKNLTGREYLKYIARLRKANCNAEVARLAERLKLDLDKHIHDLSKGNRQKVGVIQAFMHQPKVLILDEPTSGLDPLIQREFETILDEVKERGAAVLLSSHVLSEVEHLADRIAVISEGKIVLNQSIEVLKSKVPHTISFTFATAPNPANYAHFSSNINVESKTLTCSVTGSEAALLKQAVADGALTVRTNEPSLEQIFLKLIDSEVQL